jgi:hypothetical protein
MIFLNLQEADTGRGLGGYPVAELPRAGGTFAIPNGNGFTPYEVLEVFTTPAPNRLTGADYWARLRRKPDRSVGL